MGASTVQIVYPRLQILLCRPTASLFLSSLLRPRSYFESAPLPTVVDCHAFLLLDILSFCVKRATREFVGSPLGTLKTGSFPTERRSPEGSFRLTDAGTHRVRAGRCERNIDLPCAGVAASAPLRPETRS